MRAALMRRRRQPPNRNIGVWLGNDGATATPGSLVGLKQFERRFGFRASSVGWNSKWGVAGTGADAADATTHVAHADRISRAGYVPYLSWQPEGGDVGGVNPSDFSNWNTNNNATITAYIDGFATALKNWGRPIVLRFAQEMNSSSPFAWRSINKGGLNSDDGTEYVTGWRFVYDRFQAIGTPNVRFFWCPDKPYTYDNPISQYFPGTNYCHIVGWDGYNGGSDQATNTWKSPAFVYDYAYEQVKALAPNHPIWIGETGVADTGGDGGEWMKELLWEWWPRHPDVESIQLFIMDMSGVGQGDWDLRSPAGGGGSATVAKELGARQALSRAVRRAPPMASSPASVSGCAGWYTAGVENYQSRASATTVANDAPNPVGWVNDRSGATNHLTAGDSDATRPVLAWELNGDTAFLAWDFDGSDDVLTDQSWAKGNTTNEFTVFFTMKADTNPPANNNAPFAAAAAGVDAGAGQHSLRVHWDNSTPRKLIAYRNGGAPTSESRNIDHQEWFVFAARFKAENSRLWVMTWANGQKLDEISTTDATTLSAFNPTRLSFAAALGTAGFSDYSNIKMHEAVVFNRALTDREMVGINLYLAEGIGRPSIYYKDPAQLVGLEDRWGLISHWPLDEVSDGSAPVTRVDVHGTNHLTDNNNVVNAVGKIAAQCAQFNPASNHYLSSEDNASLSVGPGVSYWGSGWVMFDALSVLRGLFGRRTSGTARDWGVFFDTNNPNGQRIKHRIYNAAGSEIATVPYDVGVSTATWYFIVWYYDAVNHLVAISVNGSDFFTVSTGVSEPGDVNARFLIGILQATTVNPHSGRVESVSFGKDPPEGMTTVATEIRDTLFNEGAGKAYPFSPDPPAQAIVADWTGSGTLTDITFGTPRLGGTYNKLDYELPVNETGTNRVKRAYVQVRPVDNPTSVTLVRDGIIQRVDVAQQGQFGTQSGFYGIVPYRIPGAQYEVFATVIDDGDNVATVNMGIVTMRPERIPEATTLQGTKFVGTGGTDTGSSSGGTNPAIGGTPWKTTEQAITYMPSAGVAVFGPGFYGPAQANRTASGVFRGQYPPLDDNREIIPENVGKWAVIEPITVTAPSGTTPHTPGNADYSVGSSNPYLGGPTDAWEAVMLQGPGATTTTVGSGARLLPVRTGDAITSVTVSAGGTGYVNGAAVVFFGGRAADVTGVNATGTINVSGGVITSVTVTEGGTNYSSTPGCRVKGTVRWYGGDGVTPNGLIWKLPNVPPIDAQALAQVGYSAKRADNPSKIGHTRVDTSVIATPEGWAEILFTNQWMTPDDPGGSGAHLHGTDLYVVLPDHARDEYGFFSRNPNDYWMKVGGDDIGLKANADNIRFSGFVIHGHQHGVQVDNPRANTIVDHCYIGMNGSGVRHGHGSVSTNGSQGFTGYAHDAVVQFNYFEELNFWRQNNDGIPWWMCKSVPVLENGESYDASTSRPVELRYVGAVSRWTQMENTAVSARGGGIRCTMRWNTVDGYFNGWTPTGFSTAEGRYSGYASECYENTFLHLVDDTWECDQNACNVGMWGNKVSQALVGLSLGPCDFGPVFAWENSLFLGRQGIAKRNTDANIEAGGLSCALVKHSGGSHPRATAFISNNTLVGNESGVWGPGELAAPQSDSEEGLDLRNNIYGVTGRLVHCSTTQIGWYHESSNVMASNNLAGGLSYGFTWDGVFYGNDLAAYLAASSQGGATGHKIGGVAVDTGDPTVIWGHLRDPINTSAALRDLRLKPESYDLFVGEHIPGWTDHVVGRNVRMGFEP